MADAALVGGAFADFLAANREPINQAVAVAARQHAAFDAAAFADLLRATVAPIVEAVDRRGDGFVARTAQVLVEVAIDLHGQRRLDGAVRDGWDRLLPALAPQLAASPREVVASISNALDTLSRADGARPEAWIERMHAVAAHAPDVDVLLRAGQVAAWRSGMAAYREGALAVASELDPAIAAAALGLPDGEGADPVATAVARLAADRWSDGSPVDPSAVGADVLAVGAFRGFGGAFVRPPVLVAVGDEVRVTDGRDAWAVVADRFGSAVVRVSAAGAPAATGSSPRGAADPGLPAELASIPELTTWAPIDGGHVVTSALTHEVRFVRGLR